MCLQWLPHTHTHMRQLHKKHTCKHARWPWQVGRLCLSEAASVSYLASVSLWTLSLIVTQTDTRAPQRRLLTVSVSVDHVITPQTSELTSCHKFKVTPSPEWILCMNQGLNHRNKSGLSNMKITLTFSQQKNDLSVDLRNSSSECVHCYWPIGLHCLSSTETRII